MATTQTFRYRPSYWSALVVDDTLTQADIDAQFPMGIGSGVPAPLHVNTDGTVVLSQGQWNEITLNYGSRLMREMSPLGEPTGNQAWVRAEDWNDDLVQAQ